MDIKRVLAGASIVGVVGLPAWFLGTGVAAAQPAPAQECADPAACERPAEEQPAEKRNTASDGPAIKIPEEWSREVAKNVANLPSPVEASVPVEIGLPDVVLPDVVPDFGFSVPFILNPPEVNLPAPQMPKMPSMPWAKLTPW
ncbi:hypothetical protein E4P42_15025 [Mycobacterium sp. PS03-16]|uniref:hypothetical protein n=1 Tax=Mycobacterium sp. PS03-16 TaxID=2559611 RepID=UPI001073B35A|nr:hypothetical protein [Mycobacterium sp. PS03-16]TFV57463.1 hypothetical protein E4P42_15025 [Mycobacterium sp. PS03-16]